MKKPQSKKETLRSRQKAETYALILSTARDLFEKTGFEKTTLRLVASEVGNTAGAIFKHFKSKSELLAAILYDDIESVQAEAIKTAPADLPLQKQFLFIAECFYRYYSLRPVLSKMLVQQVLFIEGEWQKKFDDQTNRLIFHVAELVQKAKDNGGIRQDVDNTLLASAFFSHYLFILIHCARAPVIDPKFAVEILEGFIDQTTAGCQ